MPRTVREEGVSWLSGGLQKLSEERALCSFERRSFPPYRRSRQRSGVAAAAFLSAAGLQTPQREATRFDPVHQGFRLGPDDRTPALGDTWRADGHDVAARDCMLFPGCPEALVVGSLCFFG